MTANQEGHADLVSTPHNAMAATELIGDSAQQSPPNAIILIMTDQQPFDAIPDGRLKIRTPNLDKLSERGGHFRNAYTQSVPARTTLRTGCTFERH
jgi:arylsulfatase A-like enzyme